MDEYLDLVNEKDEVIGRKLRSEVYAEGRSNFRVINAFIVNQKGELWIPRRTGGKRFFPLCLDVSVGGHVESGETYDQALRRETSEEINVDLTKVDYRLLGHLTPQNDHVSANTNVYEITLNEAPEYNKHDFIEDNWFTPNKLLELVAAGERVKSDLPILVKIFYGNRT